MNPLVDHLAVAALITGAAAFFIVRFIKRRRAGKQGCASGCGCTPAKKH
jgi:hypothetical protein